MYSFTLLEKITLESRVFCTHLQHWVGTFHILVIIARVVVTQ